MMPYDAYRLYQAERAMSPREMRWADQMAAQLVSAVAGLFRPIAAAARRPYPPAGRAAGGRAGASRPAAQAACRGTMAG
jgi:hypothetical protein